MKLLPDWMVQSRKAQIALGAVGSILLTRALAKIGLPADDVQALTQALGTLASVWIGAIALEDFGSKSAPPAEKEAATVPAAGARLSATAGLAATNPTTLDADEAAWLKSHGVSDLIDLNPMPAAVSPPAKP